MTRLAKSTVLFLFSAAAATECQEQDHATLLQIQSTDASSNPQSSTDAMISIIDAAFEGLQGKAGSALPPSDKKTEASVKQDWQICARLDYTSFTGLDSSAVQDIQNAVGLTELCHREDPTCKAFHAAFGALQELRELKVQPKMQNYSLVNWLQQEVGFASWGSDSQVDVDYTSTPPTARTQDSSAGTGYAFCELVVTTLRQSNRQLFNSCGPSSVLSALIMRSPVEAFRKGLQLYYTGTLPGLPAPTCSYIYDQQPGIMPFEAGQPGFSTFPGAELCPGDLTQEEGLLLLQEGKSDSEPPCQAIGIQKMFITTLLTSYDNKLRQAAGVAACPEIYTAIYPGENEQEAGRTKEAHLTAPAFIRYACDVVLADGVLGTCKYISDKTAKCTAANLQAEVCEGAGITSESLGQLQRALHAGQRDHMATLLSTPRDKAFVAAANGDIGAAVPVLLSAFMPSASGSAMDMGQVCAAKSAMLFIFSDGTTGFKADASGRQSCNHWITMAKCEEDSYHVWTWGVIVQVPKVRMLKIICGAVVH